MKKRSGLCAELLFLGIVQTTRAEVTRDQLDRLLDSSIHGWRWRVGDAPGAERPDFDDSQWQAVDLGFEWWPHDSMGWFRARVTVPEYINGIPTKGAAIRVKAGVDNGAEAYVNGVFQQEFEWAKGDFVLTENAQPGETITVALHAVNRPGFGRLFEACLVCGAGEDLVDALRALVKDLDAALEDGEYVPSPEAAHWLALVHDAMQTLDMAAYRAGNRDAFLASVAAARNVLLSDRVDLEERLGKTAQRLAALEERICQGARPAATWRTKPPMRGSSRAFFSTSETTWPRFRPFINSGD